jgi:hypothetical protein
LAARSGCFAFRSAGSPEQANNDRRIFFVAGSICGVLNVI